MDLFKNYPNPDTLVKQYGDSPAGTPLKVNNHIHTPFSFSAFQSIHEAVMMAADEEIAVLGINDFYVTEGYPEFLERCMEHSIFPLFNVEMIGVSKQLQQQGIRVNDPNNPGRIYISGKGLAYPSLLPDHEQLKVARVIRESNKQVAEMVDLLNGWLGQQGVDMALSVEEILSQEARGLLRERHVAKMLRIRLNADTSDDDSYYRTLKAIFGGNLPSSMREDVSGTEDELRARLLKAGAPAFVPEDVAAFMPAAEIIHLIREAGGIPTYPLLLDGAGAEITEFEAHKEQLLESLQQYGFQSIEFIPLRNRAEALKSYAGYFYDHGFIISFGTEHNTSAMRPLTVSCRDAVPLDRDLMDISYRGAAYIAAHQYLVAREGKKYRTRSRDQMEELGNAVIRYFRERDFTGTKILRI
jgi:hypothetical protein